MSNYVWGDNQTQFFFSLDPDTILDAVDELGLRTTGRCLTLNSMENRVYEIEIDIDESKVTSASDRFVVAKFYRPGRWTKKQILEEHEFLLDLQENELPVIAPIKIDGQTLFKLNDHEIFYTLFPKKGGRPPEEMNADQLELMGRTIARIHNVGASKKAKHRIQITPESFGKKNLNFLLDSPHIPQDFKESYSNAVNGLYKLINPMFEGVSYHRIHGDCHRGNIILRDEGPYFIDFDDMLVGPAVQDIWLITPGIDPQGVEDRNILLEAYETMRDFDYTSLKLIEPLRALRYIHFSAWIAKRWEDPAFKIAFPYFGTQQYWHEQTSDLYNQIRVIEQAQNPYQY